MRERLPSSKAVTWNYDGGLTEMYASEQCQVDEEWMMRIEEGDCGKDGIASGKARY